MRSRHGADGTDGQRLLALAQHSLGRQRQRVDKLILVTESVFIVNILVLVLLLVTLMNLLNQCSLIHIQLPLKTLLQLREILTVGSDSSSRHMSSPDHITVAVLMSGTGVSVVDQAGVRQHSGLASKAVAPGGHPGQSEESIRNIDQ